MTFLEESLLYNFFMSKVSAAESKAFTGLTIGAQMVVGDVPVYMKILVKMTYLPPRKNDIPLVASQP